MEPDLPPRPRHRGRVRARTPPSRALHARGADLVLVDRDASRLVEIAAEFPGAQTHVLDVAEHGALERLAEAVDGDGPLHLLFNNAGIALPCAFEAMPAEDFDRVMDVDFHAVVRLARACLPMLHAAVRADGEARIVNTSSLFGLLAPTDSTACSATKFAVAGFGQALGHEMEGTGVGVTTLHPGELATRIVDNSETLSRYEADEAERWLEQSRRVLLMPPDRADEIVVRGVERHRIRIFVGSDARVGNWLRRIAPVRYRAIVTAFVPDLKDR